MNNEITNKMDDLLVKYMLGETSAVENAEVKQWLSLSESNQRYYNELQRTWEISLSAAEHSGIDEDKAWENLQKRISEKPVIKRINPESNTGRLLRIAAIVVVIFSIGFFVYRFSKPDITMLTVSAIHTPHNDTLSDGSTVALNTNSTITYPEKFSGNMREVNLKGEAFFQVKPNKNQPFIIHTGTLNVRVVGTSFNVKEFNSDSAQVIVETGIVKVYAGGSDTVLLMKGEGVVYNAATHSFRKSSTTSKYYDYYFTKTLVFENTELSEVVKVLNTIFNSKLVISKENMKTCRLTATFRNESIETIIHILQQTFGLTVTTKDGQIFLNGNGCN